MIEIQATRPIPPAVLPTHCRRVILSLGVGLTLALLLLSSVAAANPTSNENFLAGTADWGLTNPATNREIEGYASATSVNSGDSIDLFVNTASANYTIDVFRMGWYDGLGARQVAGPIAGSGTVPPNFYRDVAKRLRKENKFIERSIKRGEPMVPMLKRELEAAEMPPLLHYVALIESGYKNTAASAAKAAGLWQFMPATGRQYGLKVSGNVDERRDPEKAAQAAARYLRDLAFEFGGNALRLSLAGYNRGENGVRRSLKKLDDPFSDRSYWAPG